MNRLLKLAFTLCAISVLLIGCGGNDRATVEVDKVEEVAANDRVSSATPVENKYEQFDVAEEAMEEATVVEQIVEVEVIKEVEVERVVEVVVEVEGEAMADDGAMAEDSAESVVSSAAPIPTQQPKPIVPEQRTPSGMIAEESDANPFTLTIDDNLSTFAIDVDTGSYTVMRNYLGDAGSLPPEESVRVEEYVNFFDQDYGQPDDGAFAIHIDGAPSPYAENDKYHLVRVGIQGYEVPDDERPPALLIFVVDTSGSMNRSDRLGLVKDSLELLVGSLRPDDRVGIIEYGSNASEILSPTSVRSQWDIIDAIDNLRTGGSTNAEEGIMNGYRMANRYRLDGEITRLIVLSDGVANVGNTTSEAILEHARSGVSLSTFGFGMGSYNDALMEQLANQGDGSYAYIDTLREAQRVFVNDLSGTLLTIAKDAKIQVDFNADVVEQYRLIGYENRDVADNDFRNDSVDAGEIGAGHSVTALYEVRLSGDVDASEPALTVHVRYEDTESGNVREIARSVAPNSFAQRFEDASATFQLSAIVAEYAEILQDSYWARNGDMGEVWQEAVRIGRLFPRSSDVAEFVDLVGAAASYMGY